MNELVQQLKDIISDRDSDFPSPASRFSFRRSSKLRAFSNRKLSARADAMVSESAMVLTLGDADDAIVLFQTIVISRLGHQHQD